MNEYNGYNEYEGYKEYVVESSSKTKLIRGAVIALVVLYWICPDLVPGPIDDIIVTLVGMAVNKKMTSNNV